MGGALAVHAAVDMLIEDFRDHKKFKVYTYGAPRAGNKAFEKILREKVEDAYRIVHWKDLVAHVPPCVPKSFGPSSCAQSGSAFFYPFHTLKEVFYTGDFEQYLECFTEEQSDCSN